MQSDHLVDKFLIAAFVAFGLTSLTFDRAAALDWVGPDVLDPFGRTLWWYGVNFDPVVAHNPLFLRIMSAISAFVFGPFYVVLVWGLIKRRAWIRTPAIAYAAVMLYNMTLHVFFELLCDTPPLNLAVFASTYALYVLAPIVLLHRMSGRWPHAGGERR